MKSKNERTNYASKVTASVKAKAYYNYVSFRNEAICDWLIEDALLANSSAPKISEFGLEPTTTHEGWWYTGVDEERIDQLIDAYINTH